MCIPRSYRARYHQSPTYRDNTRAGTIAGHVRALIDKLREGDSDLLRSLIAGGQIGQGEIAIQVDRDTLADAIAVPAADIDPAALIVTAPFQLKRRGVEGKIIAGDPVPQPDQVLITALARAHRWIDQIRAGTSITEIANSEGRSPSRIRSQVNLAFLSPAIQAAILNGTQPPDLTIRRILKIGIPPDWDEQAQRSGFSNPLSA